MLLCIKVLDLMTQARQKSVKASRRELKRRSSSLRAKNKPRLTVRTLNFLIRRLTRGNRLLLEQAQEDVVKFVREHFLLSGQQQRDLRSLRRDDIVTVKNALGMAARDQKLLSASCHVATLRPDWTVIARSSHFELIAKGDKKVLNMPRFGR
jgi:hypothetical protein